ncbi:MAG: malate dehydrogenase (oxaloacetate-decarboxylating)(NADP+), partial [Urechidicola sp.]
MAADEYRNKALKYHLYPTPGKLQIEATTPLTTQQDLALAYSPGVAFPCEEIAADPMAARLYTAKANLVGVITNGT